MSTISGSTEQALAPSDKLLRVCSARLERVERQKPHIFYPKRDALDRPLGGNKATRVIAAKDDPDLKLEVTKLDPDEFIVTIYRPENRSGTILGEAIESNTDAWDQWAEHIAPIIILRIDSLRSVTLEFENPNATDSDEPDIITGIPANLEYVEGIAAMLEKGRVCQAPPTEPRTPVQSY